MNHLLHEQLARERMARAPTEAAVRVRAARLAALRRAERRAARATRAAQRARLAMVGRPLS